MARSIAERENHRALNARNQHEMKGAVGALGPFPLP